MAGKTWRCCILALFLALQVGLARDTAHARRQAPDPEATAATRTIQDGVSGQPIITPQPGLSAKEAPGNAPIDFAVLECHRHGTALFCMHETAEYQMQIDPTVSDELPHAFTRCHIHGKETFCFDKNGEEVQALEMPGEAVEDEHEDEDEDYEHDDHEGEDGHHHHDDHEDEDGHDHHDHHDEEDAAAEGEECEKKCHFHAGVEHCTCVGPEKSPLNHQGGLECSRKDREYNIPLRIGLTFVVLIASGLGVFAPIFLQHFLPPKLSPIVIMLKQFGTGIIISTAFVHLFTHAILMFQNPCLEGVEYEGLASVILMAGLMASFLIEYTGQRFVQRQHGKAMENTQKLGHQITHHGASEALNISVMEAGILFHSLLIGLTLVVAGDSFFVTLFAVIVFHQFFEGIALGSRLATVGTSKVSPLANIGCSHHFSPHDHMLPMLPPSTSASGAEPTHGHDHGHGPSQDSNHESAAGGAKNPARAGGGCVMAPHEAATDVKRAPFPLWKKVVYAAAFALVTPLGMAMGIGMLGTFNGNDPATIVAIGVLDAFSAGILLWVGVVEMWAGDWMGGEMSTAGPAMTAVGLVSLIGGMVLMSALGKWA